MTPLLQIKPKHRQPGWLCLDMRDDEDVGYVVVIPTFGRDHHCGMDCWCNPDRDGDMVSHNAEN
jgi:hypothetical protein